MKKNHTFFEDVYQIVQLIPKGKVTSYGAIANFLGTQLSARMVGWAMNKAHLCSDIPAHRVVNRKGCLTGKMHFDSPDEMQKRLENEGIEVVNDKITDFNAHFWNPEQMLD